MASNEFYGNLAQRESGGNPKCVNSFGFMGLYQMGNAALQDVGYINSHGGWTGKDGAHLVGHQRLAEYVHTGGQVDACDEIGTRCSEYVRQFA
ncbi:hypothetical protein Bhyg_11624, partial [Pseudolycoriella hygida]